MGTRTTGVFGGTVLALAAALAMARADDKAITLSRTYKAGAVSRYNSTIRVKALGNELKQESLERAEVKSVEANGNAVISLGMESGSYTLNGKTTDLPKSEPWTLTRDKRNRLVKVGRPQSLDFLMVPEVRELMFACLDIVYPEKPVAPGDSWTTELDNPAVKEKKLTLKTTFKGQERLDGATVNKVEQHGEADTDLTGGKLTCDLTAWLDPANGEPVKFEIAFKGLPTQVGKLDSVGSSVRVKEGEKR